MIKITSKLSECLTSSSKLETTDLYILTHTDILTATLNPHNEFQIRVVEGLSVLQGCFYRGSDRSNYDQMFAYWI